MKLTEHQKELVDALHEMGLENKMNEGRFGFTISSNAALGVLRFAFGCDDMIEGCYVIPIWKYYYNKHLQINEFKSCRTDGKVFETWTEANYYPADYIEDTEKRNYIIEQCRNSLSTIKEALIEIKAHEINKDFE